GIGNDIINVGGRATITGGEGADTFQLANPALPVTITDFNAAEGDTIDYSGFFGYLQNYDGSNPFGSSGYLHFEQSGADVVLKFDTDGAAGAGSATTALTLLDTDLADITAASLTPNFDPAII
ncbi:type I secretion C-terminal target domain-containing protein, partial [Mesorhizobium sp. B2-4-6]|uniref:type I secretion C-terminal target domain-containing protein n=1 Tax=Mesorhizobium sp. B2-4-6 TaxID=2589943 RepID=UPI001126FD5A